MGFTHYWRRPRVLDAETFAKLSLDVRFMLDHLPEHSLSAGGFYKRNRLHIRGAGGKKSPIILPNKILLNGDYTQRSKQEYMKNQGGYERLSHQDFLLEQIYTIPRWNDPYPGDIYGDFCKTARKPYDLIVAATLVRFKRRFGEQVSVSSDGCEEDWKEAVQFCQELFGEGYLPFNETPKEDEQ